MSREKSKRSRSSDGLKVLGRESGKIKYEATLRKKIKGQLIIDTTRIILADSKAEALIEKARILEELLVAKLGLRSTTRKRFGEAIDEWLPTLRIGTRMPYGSHLKKFAQLGLDRYLDEFGAQELQRVIATVDVSEKTASQVRVAIMSFFAWAKEMGYVPRNVALETERRKRRKTTAELLAEQEAEPPKKALTVEELNRFLLALRDRNPDHYVIAGTQFLLGCRFGEVSALRWEDIDESGVVHVRVAQ